MKRKICILLAGIILCCAACGSGSETESSAGAVDKSGDSKLQEMIEDVAPKFELLTFEDKESGTSLEYQLYVPEDYDENGNYL